MKKILSKPELFNTLKTYNRQKFMSDLMAGIIVGIVALPLAIAFGIASGVSPEKGIITAIVAGFIISFLGGTKVQIGGPTGAFIVIIYGIVNNPEYGLSGLIVATMLAGVILILLGLFKLGAVIKFIPYPIIIGFTAGIAVTIFTTQMGDVLGLTQSAVDAAGNTTTIPLKTPGDFIGKWICYFQHIDTFNLWNFLMAILAIIIIAGLPRLLRKVPVLNKIPGSLYGILIVTGLVLLLKNQFGIDCIDTIGDRFKIKAQLPDMEVPVITWEMVQKLMQQLIKARPKYDKGILSLRYLMKRKALLLVKTTDEPRELVDDFNSEISEEEFAQKLVIAREKAPKAVEYLLRLIRKQVFTDELVTV